MNLISEIWNELDIVLRSLLEKEWSSEKGKVIPTQRIGDKCNTGICAKVRMAM